MLTLNASLGTATLVAKRDIELLTVGTARIPDRIDPIIGLTIKSI